MADNLYTSLNGILHPIVGQGETDLSEFDWIGMLQAIQAPVYVFLMNQAAKLMFTFYLSGAFLFEYYKQDLLLPSHERKIKRKGHKDKQAQEFEESLIFEDW